MLSKPFQSGLMPCFGWVLALCITGLSACGARDTRPVDSIPLVDTTTAALVNGSPIYSSDVELEAVAQGLIEPGDMFDATHPDFRKILEQLIDQRLLAEEALRRKLDQDSIARRRLQAGRERLLGNILVENLISSEITEAAIDQVYAEQVKLQQLDDEVRVRHILVDSQQKAETVLDAIENGQDFTEAAFAYSDDIRTRLDGGDFGWVDPNAMPDPFPVIIGNTGTGALSEPFETARGWHILRVDERRTRPPKTKAEMRPEIITFLTFTHISSILRQLRIKADIVQYNPGNGPDRPATQTNDQGQDTR